MNTRVRITARQRQRLALYHREHGGAECIFLSQAGGLVTVHGLVNGTWMLLQSIEGV